MTLEFRTRDACYQLTRYDGGVFNTELADVLDALTDINDDMQHGRDSALIKEQIEKAKLLLDTLASQI